MAAFDSRRREPPVARTAATDSEPPLRRGHLLALQRSVGNAAVCGSLPRGLGRRDRNLPDDPHSLSDVSAAAKDIVMDKDTVSVAGRPWYFKHPQLKARPGLWVETRFGDTMAADPKDTKAESALRAGLGSIGLIKFGLDADPPADARDDPMPGSGSKGPRRQPSTDLTQIEEMDLTQFGGQDGRYRFTAVVRASDRKRTDVDLIVERLGPRRAAFKDWAPLGAQRQQELEKRFKQFGYKRAQDEEADVLKWDVNQWGRVLQAIELVPEDLLRGVTGIVWERAHTPPDAPKESGHYETTTGLNKGDTPTRRLQLMDLAFKSDSALIETVAHEIGHAISNKPTETGGKAIADDADYQKAVKADGPKAITKYGDTNSSEHYAEAYSMFIAEPATMKVLRPNVFAFFEKQRAAAGKKP